MCKLRVHVDAQSYGRTNLVDTHLWYVPLPANNPVLVTITTYAHAISKLDKPCALSKQP